MRRNRAVIVGDEMQKVLSNVISNEVKDPRIPFMTTVTSVKMSPDLAYATCMISVYGTPKEKTECLKAVRHATKFIRCQMCKYINLRVAPELIFELDDSLEEQARLNSIIDKVIAKDEALREQHQKGNESN